MARGHAGFPARGRQANLADRERAHLALRKPACCQVVLCAKHWRDHAGDVAHSRARYLDWWRPPDLVRSYLTPRKISQTAMPVSSWHSVFHSFARAMGLRIDPELQRRAK